MLSIKQLIITTLQGDATLSNLKNESGKYIFTKQKVFVASSGMDLPEVFPAIAIDEVQGEVLSNPRGARETHIRVQIFSLVNQYEVEIISERIIDLLDYVQKAAISSGYSLHWSRLTNTSDMPIDEDRKIWGKVQNYRFWIRDTSVG